MQTELKVNRYALPFLRPRAAFSGPQARALVFAGTLALATGLRLALISGFRFQPDEALYATWARLVATGQDTWLTTRAVDKPPLFIYTLAGLFTTLGASETIARLPNELASAISVALVYLVARGAYGTRVALWAAAAMALSPLSILFAATAFTDPFMLMWLLAAIWLMQRRRPALGGVAFGLALATKQDALLFAPMIALLFWGVPSSTLRTGQELQGATQTSTTRNSLRFLSGLALPLAFVVLWSVLRPQPDFLSASLEHYGPLSFVTRDEFVRRTGELLAVARSASADWLVLLAAIILLMVIWRERKRADLFLAGSIAYWLTIHVVVSVPAWDRYVLPLAPAFAIMVARALVWTGEQIRGHALRLAGGLAVLLALAAPAAAALNDGIPVGRDFDSHAGVDQVGEFFWHVDTTATVLYEHGLSWELDYYTFGRQLDRRWMPDVRTLAADAAHMPLARRYVVLAAWEAERAALPDALSKDGLKTEVAFIARRADGVPAVYVYLLTPKDLPGEGYASTGQSGYLGVY